MRVATLLCTLAHAANIKHDVEAMEYCRGKPEGFYENPNACDNYFFCWNNGTGQSRLTRHHLSIIQAKRATSCTVPLVWSGINAFWHVNGLGTCPLRIVATLSLNYWSNKWAQYDFIRGFSK